MFKMKELEPFIEMSATMKINDIEYTITKVEEMSGIHAVWVSDSYTVYATPYFENILVPVHVIAVTQQEIGTDGYLAEIDSFERYVKVVKTLTAKILRRQI
jgi:hypothetical protein